MNVHASVQRDEPTVAVENTSYRWAYIFLSFALLIDVFYRAAVHHKNAWDLIALIIIGFAVRTIYQARQKVLGKAWLKLVLVAVCTSAVIAVIVAVVTAVRKAM